MRTWLALFLVLVCACARGGDRGVVGVPADDAGMNAAIEQARSTLPAFLEELAHARPSATYSIKARFEEDGQVEHIWLVDPRHDAGVIRGVLGNEPVYLSGVALGQRVEVSRESVSDWVVYESGRYRGGFTLRCLRDRMTAEERQEMDEQMGAVPSEP